MVAIGVTVKWRLNFDVDSLTATTNWEIGDSSRVYGCCVLDARYTPSPKPRSRLGGSDASSLSCTASEAIRFPSMLCFGRLARRAGSARPVKMQGTACSDESTPFYRRDPLRVAQERVKPLNALPQNPVICLHARPNC